METHEVFNQSPVFENENLYSLDLPLQRLFARNNNTHWGLGQLEAYGEAVGSKEWIDKGAMANAYTPVFHSHDDRGHRADTVSFHPAYHDLMTLGIGHHAHALPWAYGKDGAHLVRLGLFYLHGQNEAGTCCPITMTFSCVPAIRRHLPQASEWLPKIFAKSYDGTNRPYYEKSGLTIGMAMTEKQGGSDVKANTTQAKPVGNIRGAGELYRLRGHKWFCSAPMCDAFLTLAQTESGLSCFLLPRWQPDGTKNNFKIQRLKDKLGNRSNASSEIEFDGAVAWLLGEEGRGISVILEMVALTRYDCMIGSTALMRRGLVEVLHHIQHRSVFGKPLKDQPLMQNVAADLCLEVEAALSLTARTAACLENAKDEHEQLLLRLLTPVGKYWITKRCGAFLGEAMECLGGNGYVESGVLPRLYREAPVNAIWEGSGNVQCLDVLRAIGRSPKVVAVAMEELEGAKGQVRAYDRFVDSISIEPNDLREVRARHLAQQLAMALQAAQLIKYAPAVVAEAYCLSRLEGHGGGWQYGMLPKGIDCMAIMQQAMPMA